MSVANENVFFFKSEKPAIGSLLNALSKLVNDFAFCLFVLISDGSITVNYEISNGHTVVITEEAIPEENVVRTAEDNNSISAKASAPEERKEGKKGNLNAIIWIHLLVGNLKSMADY